MKRGLIISQTQRINFNQDSFRMRDIKGIRDYFISNGYSIDCASYAKSWDFNQISVLNDLDIDYNDYDSIILYNDTNNFFGGEIKAHTIPQIIKLTQYTGNLFYVFTDPKLYKTCIHKIYNKGLLSKDIIYKYMNLEWTVIWPGTDMNVPFWGKIKEILYVDIFKYINRYLNHDRIEVNYNERQYDLCYYGDYRDTRRKVFDKYFNNDINKLMVGMSGSKYNNAQYIKKCPQSDLPSWVSKSKASITIGDKSHNNNIITSRFIENNIYGIINFVDYEFDTNKRLYTDPILREFNYVKNSEELIFKVNSITEDLFYEIVGLQDKEYYSA